MAKNSDRPGIGQAVNCNQEVKFSCWDSYLLLLENPVLPLQAAYKDFMTVSPTPPYQGSPSLP